MVRRTFKLLSAVSLPSDVAFSGLIFSGEVASAIAGTVSSKLKGLNFADRPLNAHAGDILNDGWGNALEK